MNTPKEVRMMEAAARHQGLGYCCLMLSSALGRGCKVFKRYLLLLCAPIAI